MDPHYSLMQASLRIIGLQESMTSKMAFIRSQQRKAFDHVIENVFQMGSDSILAKAFAKYCNGEENVTIWTL